jgi:hypothetical protein
MCNKKMSLAKWGNHLPLLETLPNARNIYWAIDNSATKATQLLFWAAFVFRALILAADAELLDKSLVTWLICAL